jgi:nicotinate dehydrogenase subunit A
MARIPLKVNGKSSVVEADPQTPLLYILRNDLQLNGPKFGCGLAQCGSCTVIMDGNAIRSCATPVSAAQGRTVTTLEGLGSTKKLSPIQKAFIDEQAAQCGYCINGMIMNPRPCSTKTPGRRIARSEKHWPAISAAAARTSAFSAQLNGHPGRRSKKEAQDETINAFAQTISQKYRRADRQLQPISSGG